MNRFYRIIAILSCILILFPANLATGKAPNQAAPAPATAKGSPVVNGVAVVAISPDGKLLAGGNENGQIDIWDTSTGNIHRTLRGRPGMGITKVSFSPDGKTLASAGQDSVVRIWNLANGKIIQEFNGHEHSVLTLAFSPDGKTLASGGEDTRIILWDVATGRFIENLTGHDNFIESIAFSPDGNTLASASKDTRIKLWDVKGHQEKQTLFGHASEVSDVSFSPDGLTLASASKDKTIRLWNTSDGRQRLTLQGSSAAIRKVAFSPDGKTLASGGDDNQVTLWDSNTGQKRETLKGHTKPVTSFTFSSDSKKLISGGKDNQVIQWDLESGQQDGKFIPSVSPSDAPGKGVDQNQEFNGAPAPATLQPNGISPTDGPGGPILLITSASDPFSTYYAEILRNEGFNEYGVTEISSLTSPILASYDLAILPQMPLSVDQVAMLGNWVNTGGKLIAMRPDKQLAGLLGLAVTPNAIADGYLLIDTATVPGNGFASQTIQYHDAADVYTLNGAESLARLYRTATTPTANPAVSLAKVGGNGGQAAAFTFDLARSIVYTRQGKPTWSGLERDGFPPIRSDDLYYGNAAVDPQSDWVDLTKASIPQADEQQRFLANLILYMNRNTKPLPRFWYFPNGYKAVVIMTGDDHGNGGAGSRFDQFIAASPAGCSVDDWECIRGTAYIYTDTYPTNAQAAAYAAQGFEIGLHVSTGCADFSDYSTLNTTFSTQLSAWKLKYTSLPNPSTNRTHCIPWSDWSTQAKVEFNNGIRLDTNYYYWPPEWVANRPGFFTGSAMPMRFADLNGTIIDVYQATTQMTDESGQSYPYNINALLDNALGTAGYYGAFTINAHMDSANSVEADAVVASAKARGVPVVSSLQMLKWLDGRNNSSFGAIVQNGNTLTFNVAADPLARNLQAMLPTHFKNLALASVTHNGNPITFTPQGIRGIEYAFFRAAAGSYVATYAGDTVAPTITSTEPTNGSTNVEVMPAIKAFFSESLDPSTVNTSTFILYDGVNAVPASVSFDAETRSAILVPSASLAYGRTYTAQVIGGENDPRVKDLAGNALASTHNWSFTTVSLPTCPCSIWDSSATPGTNFFRDSPVELGVRFKADSDGFITGIRFYKGEGNDGVHVGSLWTNDGTLLSQATFIETATGWQDATFASPVAITANTVYVASYHTNAGYAYTSGYFATSGQDRPPLHALQDGVSGSNGVFAYGSAITFPTGTYNSTNYWVDVIFSLPGQETIPPTVISTYPENNAIGVPTSTSVLTTFSEAMDVSTINTSTVTLIGPSGEIPAFVSYDAPSKTVSLAPETSLAENTVYTGRVLGGSSGVKDISGNAMAGDYSWVFTTMVTPCSAPANAIVAENCLAGNPPSEWDISGAGDPSIQGFATDISFNRGNTVTFKIKTDASAYRLDIYRLGYYGGDGARKVATVQRSAPQTQPDCLTEAATGLIDCGNWGASATWSIPGTATSGIYVAKAIRADTQGASHIVFIVRDDASHSDLLFQTSDLTWQAYNNYGGNSLYQGGPGVNPNRAYKVSYNRPFLTRSVDNGQDWLFNAEYPMVRWLEANGYDVSYFTGVDSDRHGDLIRNHKVFTSTGHDEYWSKDQRANVEAARDYGINLAFFSGNEVFKKTRWENSIDGSGTAYRSLVCYKESVYSGRLDPLAPDIWTGTWRDPTFSPPADGGRPENALTGNLFMVNDGATTDIQVTAADGKMRFWRNTSIATLAPGTTATLAARTLGYEWDVDVDNGFRPAGDFRLSTTTVEGVPLLQDYGWVYAPGTATHHIMMYRASSGALVFGAGTVQWSWGLDANHDRGATVPDIRMRQATVNLLADMNAQPYTLQPGLAAATMTTDNAAPTSTITSPTPTSVVQKGSPTTIRGTATDAGGGVVGGVEVSVDGGATWHPANGRSAWSYVWIPAYQGPVTLLSRAVDDSGRLETPGAGISLTVTPRVCPCSLWGDEMIPTVEADPDTGAAELGVRFTVDTGGYITGIRFYKASSNTGDHIGTLWSDTGALLARAPFTNETSSGWQQMSFSTPVAVSPNTVYVASYHTSVGHYAVDKGYFKTSGYDNAPLHAPQDGVSGANGLYSDSSTSVFPTTSYQSSNYWVDVVFNPPPAAPSGVTALATLSGVSVNWNANNEPDITGYNVYRSASVNGPYTKINASPTNALSFEDTLAPLGTSYYKVTAIDILNSESIPSMGVNAVMTKANLILNPGFELDSNEDVHPDSWTSNIFFTRSNQQARSGSYSGKHYSTGNATYTLSQSVANLTPGTTYTFVWWTNIPSTTDRFMLRYQVRWFDASNHLISSDTVMTYTATTVGWVKATDDLVAPAGTTRVEVLMLVNSLKATIYVDDFSMR